MMGKPWSLPWLRIDIRANSALKSKSSADLENGGIYHPGLLSTHVVLNGLPLLSWDNWLHNHQFWWRCECGTWPSRAFLRVVPWASCITQNWLGQYNWLKEGQPPPWGTYYILQIQWSSVMHVFRRWEYNLRKTARGEQPATCMSMLYHGDLLWIPPATSSGHLQLFHTVKGL